MRTRKPSRCGHEPRYIVKTPYHAWIETLRRAPHRGRGPKSLDPAPRGSAYALAEYLLALKIEDLRDCWAAIVLDFALDMNHPHELARPLLVIQTRLAAKETTR